MSFLDKLKQKAGDLAAGNRDKIDSYVDKAATTIDSKTQGKYADTVAKAKQGVGKGVDLVAEGAPRTGPGASPTPDPTVADGAESPFPLDPDAPRPPATDGTDGAPGSSTPTPPHRY
ncbi:MAG: antitoxin [Humibacillus sp.]